MRYYLAGPMTGVPHYNVHTFRRVAAMWRGLGHDVWTPFDSLNEVWLRYAGRDFQPHSDVCENDHEWMPDVIAVNMREIVRRNGIILLDHWQHSRGSQLEVMAGVTFAKKLRTAGGEPLIRIPRLTFYDPTADRLTDADCDAILARLREPDDVSMVPKKTDDHDYLAECKPTIIQGLP